LIKLISINPKYLLSILLVILSASGKVMTEKEFDAWVKKVLGKLDDFGEVIPAK
jgi:hypothetical protein